ncbi:MAG TPA: histidine--tRNA ligase [Steroidobacteraceae bacterium]|jgi:histidyl-tRNA synthetase|nr:histidine--tRNA ligase [Steroidobacteraceae bacterium]
MLRKPIAPVRGMNDVLPAEIGAWQHLEQRARSTFAAYGYEEVRIPLVEHTELFKRSIGEYTDIVEKEMYTFEDVGGDSLTLRPEATAGIARAVISNGMLRGARHKLWCTGAMFRHERPQQGRYRQFHQIDVEAIGFAGPDIDVELIALTARLWRALGLTRVRLMLNSLGTSEARAGYREVLVDYLRAHEGALDEDSRRRLGGNPLRILDSKNPQMRALIDAAPLLSDHLDEASRAHFAALCAALDDIGIPYAINPRLVRGLDYYSRTVFEWVSDELGAQDAVCSGGRYDGLIAQLGGESTPAIGFALGIERCVALMRLAGGVPDAAVPELYIVTSGERAERAAPRVAETLRDALPGRGVQLNLGGGNFKTQFRRADRSGARLALILGDEELDRGMVAVKPLRREGGQTDCPLDLLAGRIAALLDQEPAGSGAAGDFGRA